MKKIKVYCKNNSSYQTTYQRGNTLVPVIIGLAISAIATIAFLNQGANLSQKNKILMAQNEIARAIQQWNILKSTKPLSAIASADIPTITNVFGQDLEFTVNLDGSKNKQAYFTYKTNSANSCARLKSGLGLSSNMEGISSLGVSVPFFPNPVCGTTPPRLLIRLD